MSIERKNPNGDRCFGYGVNGNGQAECYWPECGCCPQTAPPAAVPAGYALVSEMLAAAEDAIDSAMTDMGFGGMDVDLTIQRVKRLMLNRMLAAVKGGGP